MHAYLFMHKNTYTLICTDTHKHTYTHLHIYKDTHIQIHTTQAQPVLSGGGQLSAECPSPAAVSEAPCSALSWQRQVWLSGTEEETQRPYTSRAAQHAVSRRPSSWLAVPVTFKELAEKRRGHSSPALLGFDVFPRMGPQDIQLAGPALSLPVRRTDHSNLLHGEGASSPRLHPLPIPRSASEDQLLLQVEVSAKKKTTAPSKETNKQKHRHLQLEGSRTHFSHYLESLIPFPSVLLQGCVADPIF